MVQWPICIHVLISSALGQVRDFGTVDLVFTTNLNLAIIRFHCTIQNSQLGMQHVYCTGICTLFAHFRPKSIKSKP